MKKPKKPKVYVKDLKFRIVENLIFLDIIAETPIKIFDFKNIKPN